MQMIKNFFATLLIGLIEGITQWLPISADTHMHLLNSFYKIHFFNTTEGNNGFYNLLQAVLFVSTAIVFLYLTRTEFAVKEVKKKKVVKRKWILLVVSTVPYFILSLFLHRVLMRYLDTVWIRILMLIGIACIFLVYPRFRKEGTTKTFGRITPKQFVIIALLQCVNLIPGSSFLATSLFAGCIAGLSKKLSKEWAFAQTAVFLLEKAFVLLCAGVSFSIASFIALVLSALLAMGAALFILQIVRNYVRESDEKIYGYEVLCISVLMVLCILTKTL